MESVQRRTAELLLLWEAKIKIPISPKYLTSLLHRKASSRTSGGPMENDANKVNHGNIFSRKYTSKIFKIQYWCIKG